MPSMAETLLWPGMALSGSLEAAALLCAGSWVLLCSDFFQCNKRVLI
jgi:hypothetical protein